MRFFIVLILIFSFIMVPGHAACPSADSAPGATPFLQDFSAVERQASDDISKNNAFEAIKLLEACRPRTGDFAMYNYIYAEALRQEKKPYKALEHYRLAYLFLPAGRLKEQSLLSRADIYAQMGFYEEAASAYMVFLNLYGDSEFAGRAHLGLADMLFKTGHYDDALHNYEKAGNSSAALYGKAEALAASGKAKEAYALFKSLLVTDARTMANTPLARYSMGETCRLLGKADEAKTYLDTLTAGGEFNHRAAYSLGLIIEGQGDAARAAELFQMASDSSETGIKIRALIELARCNLKLERPDEALNALTEVSRSRSFGDAYYNGLILQARALGMKGDYMEAAALLKNLLVKKDYARVALDELQSLMETALAHDGAQGAGRPGKFLQVWRFAGALLMERDRADFVFKAAAHLESQDIREFVNINLWVARNGGPQLARAASRDLAFYYARMREGRSADFFFRQAKLSLKDESNLRLSARIRFLNGDFRGAEKNILSIKNLSEADLELLAKVMPRAGDSGAAAGIEKRLSKMSAPAALYVSLADIEYGKGILQKALEYYKYAAAGRAPGAALSPEDLKWTLFRIQSLEKQPETVLGSLERQGGLTGRYAEARIREDGVMDQVNELKK